MSRPLSILAPVAVRVTDFTTWAWDACSSVAQESWSVQRAAVLWQDAAGEADFLWISPKEAISLLENVGARQETTILACGFPVTSHLPNGRPVRGLWFGVAGGEAGFQQRVHLWHADYESPIPEDTDIELDQPAVHAVIAILQHWPDRR